MTVANMIIHGGVGEVVWHDSLWPDSWYGGWKVNEYLNKPLGPAFGIPHVRTIEKEQSYIWRSWEARRIQIAEEKEKQAQPAPKLEPEPKVVTLADDSVIVVGQSSGIRAKRKQSKKKDNSPKNGQLSLFD
ncbi:MAG: hypothetical protein LIP01_15715 [Tannerellaceae bacterium]|nr:hypothetical protein [Tannerellaceae bacterium]